MLRDRNYNFTQDRTTPWNGDRFKYFKSMVFLRIFLALWKVSDPEIPRTNSATRPLLIYYGMKCK